MQYPLHHSKRGFTIIEVMIAASLFVMVMVVSTTAFLSIVDANKRAQATRSVMDNMTLAFENMVRDIRTGTSYRCGDERPTNPDYPDCINPGAQDTYNRTFAFIDKNTNATVRYRYNGTNHSIQVATDGGFQWDDITSDDVFVEDVRFYVYGADPADQIQPRALITLVGHTGIGKSRTDFNLQTTVTQRDVDK